MSLESAKEKLAKRFEGDIDERLKEIYVAPHGGMRPQVSEGERFFLLNQIVEIFTESDTRSLLILGDSGAGKTSLCLQLCKRLWEVYREDRAVPASSSETTSSDVASSAPGPSTPHLLKPLPIYIHLAQYKDQLKAGLLEKALKKALLSAKEIRHLKTQPLLLLLDGFDEVDIQENLYQTQRWGQPGYHICMAITCRPEALVHKNKQALFEASRGQGKKRHYETMYLQSFTEEQIRVYLERYLQQNSKDTSSSSQLTASVGTSSFAAPSSSSETPAPIPTSFSEVSSPSFLRVEDYLTWFERLPSLKELIKTPFLLTVAVRALPRIIASSKTPSVESAIVPGSASMPTSPSTSRTSSFIRQKHFTQSGLFKKFLKDWFFRQAQRVKAQGLLTMLSEKEIRGYMKAYAKNLASSLIGAEGQLNERTLSEEECLRPEFIEPYQDEVLLEKYHHRDPEQNQSKHFFEELRPGVKTQTELQKSHLRAILSGCMLRSVGNQFRFIHKSIAEYLAAQELMEGLLGNYDSYLEDSHLKTLWEETKKTKKDEGLNRTLLTKEPQILARLAEMSQEDERFKELLEAIIVATKTRRGLHVAAANAISILNRAGVSFCSRDFSRIQIPGADLNESQCGGTHFEGANLKGVNFQRAYLAHAHFEGANLEGVQFGERAYWKMPSEVLALVHYASSPGVSEWLAGCKNGYAYRLNDRGQLLKSYRHKSYQLFEEDDISVNAIAVHSGSTPRLATGGSDHLIWVWGLEGAALYRLEKYTGSIKTLAFRFDGILASGSRDNTIRLWEADGTPGPVLRGHTSEVTSLVFRPDGRLASGSHDGTIRLWEVDGTPGPVLCERTGTVKSLVFRPDGGLVSGIYDRTTCIWEADGTPGPVLRGHTPEITSFVLPDGRLASRSEDTIRLWKPDGTSGRVLRGHTGWVTSLAFRPNGGLLVSGSMDKTIRLWEVDDTPEPVLRWHTREVISLALRSDGCLASGSGDNTIRLWEPDGTPGPVLREHMHWVTSLAFRPDGHLVSGSRDETICLWKADGTPGPVLRHNTGITSFALLPDGRLASGNEDGTIRLWEADSTLGLMLRGHTGEVTSFALLPDGCLASGSYDGSIRLWEPDGTPGSVLRGHMCSVTSLALCPDGRLASGSRDKTIRLWEADGTPGPVLLGHTGEVTSLALLPDGRLVSGSSDKTLRLWSLTKVRLLQTFAVDFFVYALVSGRGLLYAAGGPGVMALTIDTAHQFHVQWVRTRALKLILTGVQLQGALNLSEENHALLKQQGAEGKPQRTPRSYISWCHLFQPITGTAHVEPQRPLVSAAGAGTSPHLISDTAWVVSIARKKEGGFSFGSFFGSSGSDHAFLIIEGIQQRRRFIIRAELTYNTQTKQVHVSMKPQGNLAKFATSVAQGIEAHQFLIDASVGEQLLRHIQEDQQKVIRYSLFGDGGKRYPSLLFSAVIPSSSSSTSSISPTFASTLIPSASASATAVTETHNCLSWCRKQVMQIGQEMPTRWYNFAVTIPSDVTAPERNSASSSVSSITPTTSRR